jgi:osmotically-inducible protein OsmY
MDVCAETRLITACGINEILNPFDIAIDARAGAVTLEGQVNTLTQKEDAAQVACETPGVDRVENRLWVGH